MEICGLELVGYICSCELASIAEVGRIGTVVSIKLCEVDTP